MSTNTHESVPAIWSDERDVPFFAITARLFSPAFTAGSSVLLASYDLDDDPVALPQPAVAPEGVEQRATTVTTYESPITNS